jgi:hypothetical protein
MELAELNQRAIRAVNDDFHGLPITINANAITKQYCQDAAKRIETLEKDAKPAHGKRKKVADKTLVEMFQGRGREIEEFCDLYAHLIKGTEQVPLLLSWDLTHKGQAVECSVVELRKLHLELLKELWAKCMGAGRPKLPETRKATSRTISDNTVATTPPQDTQTDVNLTM